MVEINEVIEELNKIDNKTDKCLFVLGEELSVNEVIDHLKKNTEIGKEFHSMHSKLQEKMNKVKLPE